MDVEQEIGRQEATSTAIVEGAVASIALPHMIVQGLHKLSIFTPLTAPVNRLFVRDRFRPVASQVKTQHKDRHILEQDTPSFIFHLRQGDWEIARSEFCDFAYRVLKTWNCGIFSAFDLEDREDVKQGIYNHFTDRKCARLKKYKEIPGSTFLHWFRKAVANYALNELKKIQRRKNREASMEAIPVQPIAGPTPEQKFKHTMDIAVVEEEFLKLNRRYRVLIRASVYNSYSSNKIAVLMGLGKSKEAVAKVSKDIYTAKSALRKRIERRGTGNLSTFHKGKGRPVVE